MKILLFFLVQSLRKENPGRNLRGFMALFILVMYISEGYNNIFTHAFGKFTLITRYADYEIHMELLADLLNLCDNLLQLISFHTCNL